MGFEPTTFSLEGSCSTPELHPHLSSVVRWRYRRRFDKRQIVVDDGLTNTNSQTYAFGVLSTAPQAGGNAYLQAIQHGTSSSLQAAKSRQETSTDSMLRP